MFVHKVVRSKTWY